MTEVKLHYSISNNGDGSASVHFYGTAEEAEQADEDASEPFAEDTAGYLSLEVENGKVYFDAGKYEKVGKNYVYVPRRIELTYD